MTKRLFSILALFCCVALGAQSVFAAPQKAKATPKEPLVLVLPFQINGGPELSAMNEELPKLMAERLKLQGLRVVPAATAAALLKKKNVETLDLAEARALARAAGAQYTVYGTLNQLGEGFALDSRLVPVSTGTPAQPVAVQKKNLLELTPAVDALVERVAAGVNANRAPAGAHAGDGTVKIGGVSGGLADVTVRGMKVLDPDVVLMRLSIRKGDN
ncbi:MAG: outer membrane protein assembly factor BamA, partial [Desulfovibrionaceae bacterium]